MTTLTRTAASLAMIGLLAAGVEAQAATAATHKTKKYVHTTALSYTNPCIVDVYVAVDPYVGYCPGGESMTFSRADHYISLTAVDKSGQRVPIALVTSGTNTSGTVVNEVFCGSVKDFPIKAGNYSINPAIAIGVTGCPIPATQGTVKVQISNLK